MKHIDRLFLANSAAGHVKSAAQAESFWRTGARNTWNSMPSWLRTTADVASNMIPGVTTARSLWDMGKDISKGNWLGAAGNLGMAGIGLLPFGGTAAAAAKGVTKATPGLIKGLKYTGRVKLPGPAMGTVAPAATGMQALMPSTSRALSGVRAGTTAVAKQIPGFRSMVGRPGRTTAAYLGGGMVANKMSELGERLPSPEKMEPGDMMQSFRNLMMPGVSNNPMYTRPTESMADVASGAMGSMKNMAGQIGQQMF